MTLDFNQKSQQQKFGDALIVFNEIILFLLCSLFIMTWTKAIALVGVPTLLVGVAHINSLPFAYTIRSWWLLRSLVERAKKLNLEPEGSNSLIHINVSI